jgi:hypothetical protein
MTMPMNYLFIDTEARRAEELIPSMPYRTLLENLGRLTLLGVIAPQNPVTMLVVARLVDRARILRSGVTAAELRRALEAYKSAGKPIHGVVKALEQALETASENEGQAASHHAG